MIDERDNQLKSAPPRWWQDKGFLEQLGGPTVHQAAYRYELGRRYHIYQKENLPSSYKPLSEILSGNSEFDGKIKFQLMRCFDAETIDAGILVDPSSRKLSKSGVKGFNAAHGGNWVHTNVVAWNLECPWKRVAEMLKAQFEQQQAELGIKTDAQSRKIQEPHWQYLEVWDNWWADIVTFKAAEAHQRKTYEIARLAKSFAGPADVFLKTVRGYGYIK